MPPRASVWLLLLVGCGRVGFDELSPDAAWITGHDEDAVLIETAP